MRSIASALVFALALSVPVALAQTTKLVVLTDKGRSTFDVAMALQAPWVNDLSEGPANHSSCRHGTTEEARKPRRI